MRTATDPDHSISINESIICYDICKNDFAYNLICVATKKQLFLIVVTLPEEGDQFVWEHLQSFDFSRDDGWCTALTFSPDTSLNGAVKTVTICAAFSTRIMKIFRTDLSNKTTVQTLSGHTDYINDIAWVCEGEFLASVSDDFTCQFWNVNESSFESKVTFCLSSAGMSVKSHPEDPNKVMVAEKNGLIHFYNVRTKKSVLSVESPKSPLMSADWSQANRLFATALAGGDLIIWDLARPFVPADVKQVHEDGGRIVRFAPGSSELVVASIGRPDLTLKVFSAKSTVPLVECTLKTYGGLAWHQRLPYITAASDTKLHFWKLLMK